MSLKIFSKNIVNYIKHFLLKNCLQDVLFLQAVVLVLKNTLYNTIFRTTNLVRQYNLNDERD